MGIPALSAQKWAMRVPARAREGEIVTSDTQQHIPLNEAYLCQDCDAVGNSSMQCPACASEVLLSLARIFNRRENAESMGAKVLHFPTLVVCSPQVLLNRARG